MGLKMFAKGKLKLLSPRTRNRTAIRRIFRRLAPRRGHSG